MTTLCQLGGPAVECSSDKYLCSFKAFKSTALFAVLMAGATEHQVTIAFVNLGLVENAFLGKKVKAHLEEIQRIVDQLFQYHSIHILCVVEVGQPTIGLSVEAKKLFEEAVRAGAAKHIRGDLTFLWAECKEAMVTVHVAGVNMTKGALIEGLSHTQSWRNAMPLYLHGPTDEDRILIFLSHRLLLCTSSVCIADSQLSKS